MRLLDGNEVYGEDDRDGYYNAIGFVGLLLVIQWSKCYEFVGLVGDVVKMGMG